MSLLPYLILSFYGFTRTAPLTSLSLSRKLWSLLENQPLQTGYHRRFKMNRPHHSLFQYNVGGRSGRWNWWLCASIKSADGATRDELEIVQPSALQHWRDSVVGKLAHGGRSHCDGATMCRRHACLGCSASAAARQAPELHAEVPLQPVRESVAKLEEQHVDWAFYLPMAMSYRTSLHRVSGGMLILSHEESIYDISFIDYNVRMIWFNGIAISSSWCCDG